MEEPGADRSDSQAERRIRGLQKLAERRARLRRLRQRVAMFGVAVFTAAMVMVLAGRGPAATTKAAATATQSSSAAQSPPAASSGDDGSSSFATSPAPVTTGQS
jgi:hypothetical protein